MSPTKNGGQKRQSGLHKCQKGWHRNARRTRALERATLGTSECSLSKEMSAASNLMLPSAICGRIVCRTVERNNWVCLSTSLRSGESSELSRMGASTTTSNCENRAVTVAKMDVDWSKLKWRAILGSSFLPLAGFNRSTKWCGLLFIHLRWPSDQLDMKHEL